MPQDKNFIFIGMSGAGKSALGKRIAPRHNYGFIDTDLLILEANQGKTLQDILSAVGDEAFLKMEQEIILGLGEMKRTIIAPGGSVIYSTETMRRLRELGTLVFIDVPLPRLLARVHGNTRGIVGLKNRTYADVYAERHPLYMKHADIIFIPEDTSSEEAAESLAQKLGIK